MTLMLCCSSNVRMLSLGADQGDCEAGSQEEADPALQRHHDGAGAAAGHHVLEAAC